MNSEEFRARVIRTRRQRSASHVFYTDSSENEDDSKNEFYPTDSSLIKKSENLVHLLRSSEMGGRSHTQHLHELGNRRMVEEQLFKEHLLPVKTNKIFCSQWLSNDEIIFGTKCNKVFVYHIKKSRLTSVRRPTSSPNCEPPGRESGIHALAINPSRTFFVTGGPHSNDISVYSLPNLQPICVGERAHKDWVFDIEWLDDRFFVSGARDGSLALWCLDTEERDYLEYIDYFFIKPLIVRPCFLADKIRALSFKPTKHLAALSSNSYLHEWDMTTFEQVSSHKLPYCKDNVCLEYNERNNIFAVGSLAHVTVIDSRTYGMVKNIKTKSKESSVRSMSFRDCLLTVGTGIGEINFFDLRMGRCLEHSYNITPLPDQVRISNFVGLPWAYYYHARSLATTAVYTHCYDHTGTRFFAGGGPLFIDERGCYAALWQ